LSLKISPEYHPECLLREKKPSYLSFRLVFLLETKFELKLGFNTFREKNPTMLFLSFSQDVPVVGFCVDVLV